MKQRPSITSEKLFRPVHAKSQEMDEHILIKDIKETELKNEELRKLRES